MKWLIHAIHILNVKVLPKFFLCAISEFIERLLINEQFKLIIGMNVLIMYNRYLKFKDSIMHGDNFVNIQIISDLIDHIGYKLRGNDPMDCKLFVHDTIPTYDLNNTLVSIVIPTRDHIEDLLIPCINSIINTSTYEMYEVVVVDNCSAVYNKEILFDYVNHASCNIRVINYDNDEYNYAAIHNYVVPQCNGEYVIMLNNDTLVIEPSWIEQLVGPMINDHSIGIVGAKLLFPDNRIQHCGVEFSTIAYCFVHVHSHECDYTDGTNDYKFYPAVTGACMAMSRDLYMTLGGMDENLICAFNDTDLCMAVRYHKHKILYSPYAKLYHFESMSRGYDTTFNKRMLQHVERVYLIQKWGKFVEEK